MITNTIHEMKNMYCESKTKSGRSETSSKKPTYLTISFYSKKSSLFKMTILISASLNISDTFSIEHKQLKFLRAFMKFQFNFNILFSFLDSYAENYQITLSKWWGFFLSCFTHTHSLIPNRN